MAEAFICDAVRTPVGRYSGALSAVRADDLAESMTRAPFVIPKAESAFSRTNAFYDTTIGWRFVNPKMKRDWGVDSMPETADNVAAEFNVSRADQDAFAARSQARWAEAQEAGQVRGGDRAGDDPAEEGRLRSSFRSTNIHAPGTTCRRRLRSSGA